MPPPAARMVDRRRSAGGTDADGIGARDEGVRSLALPAAAGANTEPVEEAQESIRVPAAMTANSEDSFLSLGEAAKVSCEMERKLEDTRKAPSIINLLLCSSSSSRHVARQWTAIVFSRSNRSSLRVYDTL